MPFEKVWEVCIFHRAKCNFPVQKRKISDTEQYFVWLGLQLGLNSQC